jgi:predicted CxxxxCH...CXXCH cytochrome family protein
MIGTSIDTPNASNWPSGSSTTGTIVFMQADGTNSDMGDTVATFNGICNVCHNNADHTNYSYNSSDSHRAGEDCTACHLHSTGFQASGDDCIDCHSSAGGPTPGTTPDSAHAAHIGSYSVSGAVSTNDYGNTNGGTNADWVAVNIIGATEDYEFGCGNCHPVDPAFHMNDVVNLTLNNNHGGTLKSLNNVSDDDSGYTQDPVTCSAAYCHSKGDGTFDVTSPEWYTQTVSGNCDDCHGNSPDTNAHGVHVVGIHYDNIYTGTIGLATAGTGNTDSHGSSTYSSTINCNTCHYNTVDASANDKNTLCATCHTASPQGDMAIASGSATHLNGTADVALDAISVKSKAQVRDDITTVADLSESWDRTVSGAAYKALGAYDSARQALNTGTMFNNTTKTCSAVACHNGNSITWDAGSVSCNRCHTGMPK